jgi:hypothetical protein
MINIKKIFEYIIPYGLLELKKNYLSKNMINNFRSDFKRFIAREKSVLLIEFMDHHAENFPGLAKYLIDLGYYVDVVFSKHKSTGGARNDSSIFSHFKDKDIDKIRLFALSETDMNLLLRSFIAAQYKHIILVTFKDNMERKQLYRVDLFKLRMVCIMHGSDVSNDYFKTNKIISVVKIDCINRKSPYVVSNHYFGEFQKKGKSKTTTFFALNTKYSIVRNINLLFEACDKLYEKEINNFMVKIIGDGIKIPEKYSNNFQDFGFQNYQNMYNVISESDFILALIDQASIQYTNKASGSYTLSYGFLKPIVLHKKFSDVSGFNNENSILHETNDDLSNVMEKCINMSDNDYSSLVTALEKSEKELYNTSLNNLKEVLEVPVQYVSRDKILDNY